MIVKFVIIKQVINVIFKNIYNLENIKNKKYKIIFNNIIINVINVNFIIMINKYILIILNHNNI